ncbi:MAG: ABC transporter ATP-binding protein [Clostridia bacterium]|nr:ABC transporter ATP-binding protein [Clostridia bacterium]MDQ7791411.1 ABC transporter ATP-binding protein [Clostridia bacterium]
MTLLKATKVTKRFGGLIAIQEVDFEIEAGQIVSMIGPNGAGKTTFFNLLSGYYTPDEGSIVFDGRDVTKALPEKSAACGIARTFQNIRLFPGLMVAENILVGMHLHLRSGFTGIIFNTRHVRQEEERALDEALDILEYVGLGGKETELARNLPYGDQRRLEIARALALKPKLLLLDEPTAGMNPKESDDMKKLILRLRDERQITILLIEHDMKVVMGLSDRITVINYGVKLAEGTPDEIRSNVDVIKAYLGEEAV